MVTPGLWAAEGHLGFQSCLLRAGPITVGWKATVPQTPSFGMVPAMGASRWNDYSWAIPVMYLLWPLHCGSQSKLTFWRRCNWHQSHICFAAPSRSLLFVRSTLPISAADLVAYVEEKKSGFNVYFIRSQIPITRASRLNLPTVFSISLLRNSDDLNYCNLSGNT